MFVPIFIPMRQYDDDSDSKHGYGCQCPDCLEQKRLDGLPREYYKYRYAIPKIFVIKNNLYRALCWIIGAIGFFITISPVIFMDYVTHHFVYLPICLIFGLCIICLYFHLFDKLVKYIFQCNDSIYIEICDSYFNKETWESKIEKMNITKNYILTEEKSDWRYKH